MAIVRYRGFSALISVDIEGGKIRARFFDTSFLLSDITAENVSDLRKEIDRYIDALSELSEVVPTKRRYPFRQAQIDDNAYWVCHDARGDYIVPRITTSPAKQLLRDMQEAIREFVRNKRFERWAHAKFAPAIFAGHSVIVQEALALAEGRAEIAPTLLSSTVHEDINDPNKPDWLLSCAFSLFHIQIGRIKHCARRCEMAYNAIINHRRQRIEDHDKTSKYTQISSSFTGDEIEHYLEKIYSNDNFDFIDRCLQLSEVGLRKPSHDVNPKATRRIVALMSDSRRYEIMDLLALDEPTSKIALTISEKYKCSERQAYNIISDVRKGLEGYSEIILARRREWIEKDQTLGLGWELREMKAEMEGETRRLLELPPLEGY